MFAGDPFDNKFCNYEKGKNEDKRRGSYGVVYKAELNGEIFAIKKLRVGKVEMKYLKREIDALIKLENCENIVKYHQIWFTNKEGINLQFSTDCYKLNEDKKRIDVQTENGEIVTFTPVLLYIVMEYCERNLENIIHCITDKERKNYFRQILNGLKSLGVCGIVHRDLKPNNIFIDSNNVVKIGDFGWALHKEALTPSDLTEGRGCKEFRAPEIYDCDEIASMDITGIVDVYSFGLIYFLMCLKRKVEKKELCILTEILRTYRFYYKENYNLSIEDRVLLSRMLAKDPKMRITINE
ncbi:interferon-induced: double-stranded RNA-activated protein kinase-like protein, partial [Leptotrombidium deliense]